MAFSTDIYHLMTNDSSINSWIDGGIHYENLPENWDITQNWVVYSFNKTAQESCLGSNTAFMRYALLVKVIAHDTVTLETISDRTVSYLNGQSHNGIMDIRFLNDSHSLDLDKNIYMNTMNFEALYSA